MSKKTFKPASVTQAVFDLWSEINTWLNQWGVNQWMYVDPDDDSQLRISVDPGLAEMTDNGIDVYDMPHSDSARAHWRSCDTIVIGPEDTLPNSSPNVGDGAKRTDLEALVVLMQDLIALHDRNKPAFDAAESALCNLIKSIKVL